MTREEARELLINISAYDVDNKNIAKQEAMKLAIKALEQDPMDVMYYPQVEGITPTVVEPCDDAVSREMVKVSLAFDSRTDDMLAVKMRKIFEIIDAMPSVTPAEKVGRWIANGETFRCSECGDLACCQGRYCNECGAKMEEQS